MSLLVYRDFSGPVMYVPTAGNPTIPKDVIDATTNAIAGPAAKKSALIFFMLTLEARKPHDVAPVVIGTFSERLVSKHISARTTRAKRTHSPPCAFRRRRCPSCRKQEVGPQALERHQCGYVDCPSCHEYVHGETIFVSFKEPQSLKKRRRERGNVKEVLAPNEERRRSLTPEEEEEEEDGDDLPPLHVFFDIEAMQPHEQHIANLVVAETDEDDRPMCFPGDHCVRDFLEWLDTLTNNDTRQVNVLRS